MVLDSAVDRTNVLDENAVQPMDYSETDYGNAMGSQHILVGGTDFCNKIIVLDSMNSEYAPLSDGMYNIYKLVIEKANIIMVMHVEALL